MRISKQTRERVTGYPERIRRLGDMYQEVYETAESQNSATSGTGVRAEIVALRRKLRNYELGLRLVIAEYRGIADDLEADIEKFRTQYHDETTVMTLWQELSVATLLKRSAESQLGTVAMCQKTLKNALEVRDEVELENLKKALEKLPEQAHEIYANLKKGEYF